jgi:hypothetical protein
MRIIIVAGLFFLLTSISIQADENTDCKWEALLSQLQYESSRDLGMSLLRFFISENPTLDLDNDICFHQIYPKLWKINDDALTKLLGTMKPTYEEGGNWTKWRGKYTVSSTLTRSLIDTLPETTMTVETKQAIKYLDIKDQVNILWNLGVNDKRLSQLTEYKKKVINKQHSMAFPEHCRFKNLPVNVGIEARQIFQGIKKSNTIVGDGKEPAYDVKVEIGKLSVPTVIVLMSARPSVWNISKSDLSKVKGIVLGGLNDQVINGLPTRIPVIKMTNKDKDDCGILYKRKNIQHTLKQITGFDKEPGFLFVRKTDFVTFGKVPVRKKTDLSYQSDEENYIYSSNEPKFGKPVTLPSNAVGDKLLDYSLKDTKSDVNTALRIIDQVYGLLKLLNYQGEIDLKKIDNGSLRVESGSYKIGNLSNKILIVKGDLEIDNVQNCILIIKGTAKVNSTSSSIILSGGNLNVNVDSLGKENYSSVFISANQVDAAFPSGSYIYGTKGVTIAHAKKDPIVFNPVNTHISHGRVIRKKIMPLFLYK